MSKERFTRILTTQELPTVPENLLHFFHHGEPKVLDIPIDLSASEVEQIRESLKGWDTLEAYLANPSKHSPASNLVFQIIQKLQLRSFIIEHIEDQDWGPMSEFIQIVFKDGNIIKGSTLKNTNEEGDLYSDIHLGLDEIGYLYTSFEDAVCKYSM